MCVRLLGGRFGDVQGNRALMKPDRLKKLFSSRAGPRLAGVALLLLVAASVPLTSILSTRAAADRQVSSWRGSTEHGLRMLSSRIGELPDGDASVYQRVLREFVRGGKWRELRLIDDGRLIVASTRVEQIGKLCEVGLSVSAADHGVRGRADGDKDAGGNAYHFQASLADVVGKGKWYLDGVALTDVGSGVLSVPASVLVLAAVLVGCVAMIARWVGRHYRHMGRISESLLSRGEQVEKDLEVLRLADASDALGIQWNKLIDFAHDLEVGAKRATAENELKAVLTKSRKGDLDEVVDVLPDGVLHVQNGQSLSYANGAARRLLGLPDEPVKRRSLEELTDTETAGSVVGLIREAIDESGAVRASSSVIEEDDGETHYRVRVMPAGKHVGRGECVVTISDISQQIRAERSSSEFVAQVTHELRTPLTNIRAYTETLSSGVFDDPQMITECYNVITKETRRLSRLIDDVLSMSQLEVGSIQLEMHNVDLRALLEDAVQDIRGLADDKKIDMQMKLPSKLPVLRGDRDKLAVVMNNLLGNALKYTPDGGFVFVSCQVHPDELMVSVKDTGIGVDPADHEAIFKKFQRGSAPETSDIEGTGIGLTTAREIARRHGGDIELMSVRGEGSTFIVRLPLAELTSSLPVSAKQE